MNPNEMSREDWLDYINQMRKDYPSVSGQMLDDGSIAWDESYKEPQPEDFLPHPSPENFMQHISWTGEQSRCPDCKASLDSAHLPDCLVEVEGRRELERIASL